MKKDKDRLNFSLEHEIHKELKFRSAVEGIPVSEFIRRSVIERIERKAEEDKTQE